LGIGTTAHPHPRRRSATLRDVSCSPGPCRLVLGRVVASWAVSSRPGPCRLVLGHVVASWGVSWRVQARVVVPGPSPSSSSLRRSPGPCRRVLGGVVASWGVSSSPGPCRRVLGGVVACTGSCCGAWGLSPSPSLPPLRVLFGFPACSSRLLSSRHVSGTLGPPVVVPSSSTWALHLVSAVSSSSAGRNRWVTWRGDADAVLNSGRNRPAVTRP